MTGTSPRATRPSDERSGEMNNGEERDGFGLARAALPACSLDRRGAGAQKERLRAIAPFITDVREEAMTVVVQFADVLDVAAVDEAIAVEQQCCDRVLDFEFDRPTRSIRVRATDPGDCRVLELIATGLRQGSAR
jgi:hypothetical protein